MYANTEKSTKNQVQNFKLNEKRTSKELQIYMIHKTIYRDDDIGLKLKLADSNVINVISLLFIIFPLCPIHKNLSPICKMTQLCATERPHFAELPRHLFILKDIGGGRLLKCFLCGES